MPTPRSDVTRLLLVAAVLCFVIALLIVLGVVHGNGPAWSAGGLVAFAASFLP